MSGRVLFTSRYIPPPRLFSFLGKEIQWEEKVKYLGITLDRRLTWSSHIDQVRRKASQSLGVFNKRSGLSIKNRLMMYHKLIRLMMDYACPVLRHDADSHLKRLQQLQSKFLRIIAGTPWNMLAIYSCMRTWRFPI